MLLSLLLPQERKRRLEAEVAMLANRRQELLAEMTKDREISGRDGCFGLSL